MLATQAGLLRGQSDLNALAARSAADLGAIQSSNLDLKRDVAASLANGNKLLKAQVGSRV